MKSVLVKRNQRTERCCINCEAISLANDQLQWDLLDEYCSVPNGLEIDKLERDLLDELDEYCSVAHGLITGQL